MRIKKFVAPTINEATQKMRDELGPEAIVLSTRTVSAGGPFSFFRKNFLEVTAAVDEEQSRALSGRKGKSEPGMRQPKPGDEPIAELRAVANRFARDPKQAASEIAVSPRVREQAELHELKAEVAEIRATLREIVNHLKYSRMPALPDQLQRVFLQLVENGLDERQAADIIQAVYARLPEEELMKKNAVEGAVIAMLAGFVKSAGEIQPRRDRARVVALVGPTGVGKTTTIAKLASINKLMNNVRVGLISADTYRIGAIEQLRTFASIADIPMEVVYKPAEMVDALRQFRRFDLVFVDTVGRSPRSARDLKELCRMVEAAAPDETHLVLSAATSEQALLEAAEQFKRTRPNRMIISKVDEATGFGAFFPVLRQFSLPVSYITTGQVVPDDIHACTPKHLASMLLTGVAASA